MNQFVRFIVLMLCMSMLFMAFFPPLVHAETSRELFVEEIVPGSRTLSTRGSRVMNWILSSPETMDFYLVKPDLEVLEQCTEVQINLFNGENIVLSRDRIDYRSDTHYSWSGSGDRKRNSAIMVVRDGHVTGFIWTRKKQYRIRWLSGDLHAVIQVNTSLYPKEHIDDDPPPPSVPQPTGLNDPAALSGTSDGTTPVINLLVAYTDKAAQEQGGIEGIKALIELAEKDVNDSFGNSGVIASVKVVHKCRVDYTEVDPETDKNNLIGDDDGHMDELHDLRDAYAADVVVVLVRNITDWGGKSHIFADASTAFCLVNNKLAVGYHSFAHELGHLFGAGHDTDRYSNPHYDFGHGYCWNTLPKEYWYTIMSYKCSTEVNRIQYWSNPRIIYLGTPMGSVKYEDNAKVLNLRAPVVAAFRSATDLSVTNINLSNKFPVVGQTIAITATVKNNGPDSTPAGTPLDVTIKINDTQIGTFRVKDSSGNPIALAPGQSYTPATGINWTVVQGDHTISAIADEANLIAETDENNNTRSIENYEALALWSFTLEPETFNKDQNEYVSFEYRLKSNGLISSFKRKILKDGITVPGYDWHTWTGLETWNTSYPFTYSFSGFLNPYLSYNDWEPGEYTIRVKAYDKDNLSKEIETTVQILHYMEPPPPPPLLPEISNFSLTPSSFDKTYNGNVWFTYSLQSNKRIQRFERQITKNGVCIPGGCWHDWGVLTTSDTYSPYYYSFSNTLNPSHSYGSWDTGTYVIETRAYDYEGYVSNTAYTTVYITD